ncbi:MAG: hypothetical protein NXI00_24700, partial [Cytophagales bacterium]|nr:hypothetical protein [Cytophagales bacterium]
LTYDCLSATVPFETIYQSEDRKKYPLQDMSTFPQEYIVIEKFPKLNPEQAGSEVLLLLFVHLFVTFY